MMSLRLPNALTVFVITLSCNLVTGQNDKDQLLLNEIQFHLSAGDLKSASDKNAGLIRRNRFHDNETFKRGLILNAHIAEGYGDATTMKAYLDSIDSDKSSKKIQYYWNEAFARYCFLNQQWEVGSEFLQESIGDSKHMQDETIKYGRLFNELYLIYYTHGIEEKVESGARLPERAHEIFDELNAVRQEIPLFYIQKYLSYKIYFTSIHDTASHLAYAQEILEFGKETNDWRAQIIGHVNLASFCPGADSTKELYHLLKAEKASKHVDLIKDQIETKYRLMRYYKKRKKYERAVEWGKKAIFPSGMDYSTYFDTYHQLSEIYEAQNMFDSALYYKKIDEQKFREISQKHDHNMQTFYIKHLNSNIDEKKWEIRKNQIFIFILCFAIFVILILFFKNLKKNRSIALKNKSLESFSHILSHDLKAPIHSISNLASYILEGETALSPDSVENLRLIKQTANNSTILIHNIMTLIRSKEIDVPHDRVKLTTILTKVEENLHEIILFHKAEIRYEGLPDKMICIEVLIVQLFQNLIQNAIKYHKEHTIPNVCIRYEKQAGKGVFTITDNGIGIEKEHLQTIKGAFKQIEPSSIEKGIGLGLSICTNILQLHEGEMIIDSVYGKGTTVKLLFPSERLQLMQATTIPA